MRLGFNQFEEEYAHVKEAACGPQAVTVLIFVALEVDGMAATKMLTQLLRSDNIAYSLRPVANLDEVVLSLRELLTADIRSVFLVNCGAIYNLPKYLDLEAGADFRVYVLDNHRPLHLKNVHSRHGVVVFDDAIESAQDEVDFDDIPSDDSDADSQSEGERDLDLDSDEDSEQEEDEDSDEDEEEEGEDERERDLYGEDEEFDLSVAGERERERKTRRKKESKRKEEKQKRRERTHTT